MPRCHTKSLLLENTPPLTRPDTQAGWHTASPELLRPVTLAACSALPLHLTPDWPRSVEAEATEHCIPLALRHMLLSRIPSSNPQQH
ncbi:hypothetical protein GN956_G2784 [Arapaima gigas]